MNHQVVPRTEPSAVSSAVLSPRLFWSLLLGLCSLTVWTGCSSFFMPVSLGSFSESVTVERVEPLGPPHLLLSSHSDGLGWTVRIEQSVRQFQTVRQTEQWEGYRYPSGGNGGTMLAGAIFCPMSSLYAIAYAIGRPAHPSWDSIQEYCLGLGKLDVLKKQPDVVTHQLDGLDERTTDTVRSLHDGMVRLLWYRPHSDPIGLEQPMDQTVAGNELRVRWLADIMARNGVLLTPHLDGYGTIEYETSDHKTIGTALRITADQLLSALRPSMFRATQPHWPQAIRVRVQHTVGARISVQEARRLESRLTETLVSHGIPSVVRDQALEQVIHQQEALLSPRYTDSTVSPGHLTAASVVVHVRSAAIPKQGYIVECRLVSVATGQLLGHVTLEDREGAWERLADTTTAMVVDLLNGPPAASRAGWMVSP